MADFDQRFEALTQQLASLQTIAASQETLISELRQQAINSQTDLEELVAGQITDQITGQISGQLERRLPDLLNQLHPNLAQFLSALDSQNGVDWQAFGQLINDDGQDISAKQVEQIMQNVRVLLQDAVQGQITLALRNAIL